MRKRKKGRQIQRLLIYSKKSHTRTDSSITYSYTIEDEPEEVQMHWWQCPLCCRLSFEMRNWKKRLGYALENLGLEEPGEISCSKTETFSLSVLTSSISVLEDSLFCVRGVTVSISLLSPCVWIFPLGLQM
jgi:hypothetical protein